MQKITHTYLVNIKPTDKIQNIACGEGLLLRVSPKGKKTWYLRYDTLNAEGKRKQNIVSLGDFPIEAIAREWHENQIPTWTANYAEDVMERIGRNVFPYLGNRPIGDITPHELLAVNIPYQTLINSYLTDCAQKKKQPHFSWA